MAENKRVSYGNVSHAMDILLYFKEHKDSTLGEMAEKLNLRKSYISKILDTLKEKEFISQDSTTGRYQLGLSCLELGVAFENSLDIRKFAYPYLVDLSEKTRELIHLGIMDANVAVLLDRIMSYDTGQRLQFHLSLTSPLYSTGLGKVLLAYSGSKKIEHYLSTEKFLSLTPHTTVNPKIILSELQEIRKNGYYLSYETFETGISCIAAPIFAKNGNVVAAASICAPTVRIMEGIEHFRSKLLTTTLEISQNFGFKSNDFLSPVTNRD